jgi:hypothetical protein
MSAWVRPTMHGVSTTTRCDASSLNVAFRKPYKFTGKERDTEYDWITSGRGTTAAALAGSCR